VLLLEMQQKFSFGLLLSCNSFDRFLVGSLHVLISDFLQLCLMLSALTSMPEALGGLNSGVIYIDTEHKFTSGRLIEIAHSLSPEVLGDNLLQQLAAHVLVLHPSSVADLLQRCKVLVALLLTNNVFVHQPNSDFVTQWLCLFIIC
jgi:hypothetical protein